MKTRPRTRTCLGNNDRPRRCRRGTSDVVDEWQMNRTKGNEKKRQRLVGFGQSSHNLMLMGDRSCRIKSKLSHSLSGSIVPDSFFFATARSSTTRPNDGRGMREMTKASSFRQIKRKLIKVEEVRKKSWVKWPSTQMECSCRLFRQRRGRKAPPIGNFTVMVVLRVLCRWNGELGHCQTRLGKTQREKKKENKHKELLCGLPEVRSELI